MQCEKETEGAKGKTSTNGRKVSWHTHCSSSGPEMKVEVCDRSPSLSPLHQPDATKTPESDRVPTYASVTYEWQATDGNYTPGNVWTMTAGTTPWTNLGNAPLPEAPVRTLAIHPSKSGYLYLGTEVGLIVSENGGLNWSPRGKGQPTARSMTFAGWRRPLPR